MKLQQFGQLESEAGLLSAMLCIDEDRPHEWMIQWWGGNAKPGGVLCDCERIGDQRARLKPRVLFYVSEGAGLYAPATLTPDEQAALGAAEGDIQFTPNSVTGKWKDAKGVLREISFSAKEQDVQPLKAALCKTWDDFKAWAIKARVEMDAATYRGQRSNKFQLSTSLQRMGRNRMDRYCASEFPNFVAHAEAALGVRIKLSDRDDYATALALAQHHGLPTPLLDWTYSPYIAAFFALSDALEHAGKQARESQEFVRVYGLTKRFHALFSPTVIQIATPFPYASAIAVAPRLNPRLQAQQGTFLVTNVADLEAHIRALEVSSGESYITAADVPVSVAIEALEDLAFMGLTAATMFPGLDGIARRIRHSMAFAHQSEPAVARPEIPSVVSQ